MSKKDRGRRREAFKPSPYPAYSQSIHEKDKAIENDCKEEPDSIGKEKNSSPFVNSPEMQGGQDHRKNEHEHFKQRESDLLIAEKQHRPS